MAGVGPEDIDAVECQDAAATAELIVRRRCYVPRGFRTGQLMSRLMTLPPSSRWPELLPTVAIRIRSKIWQGRVKANGGGLCCGLNADGSDAEPW